MLNHNLLNWSVPVLAGYLELWIDIVGPPKFMGLIGYSILTREGLVSFDKLMK